MNSSEASEKAILDAAASVFAQKGYYGARVDEIADAAGMNKAMLYYRVGDKEELYRRVVLRGQQLFTGSISAAAASADSADGAIWKIIEAIAENAYKNSLVPSIILREIAGGGATLPEEVLNGIGELMKMLRNLVDEGVEKNLLRDIDPAALHFMVIGAVFTLSLTGGMRRAMIKGSAGPATAEETSSALKNILNGGIIKGGEAPQQARSGRSSHKDKARGNASTPCDPC